MAALYGMYTCWSTFWKKRVPLCRITPITRYPSSPILMLFPSGLSNPNDF